MDDWVSACRNVEVAGSRGRGRPRMTWRARLDGDMKDMGLRPGMAVDREKCGIMDRTSDLHKNYFFTFIFSKQFTRALRARMDGDIKDMGLRPGMAMDREKGRCGIMGRASDPHKRRNNGR